MIAEFWSCITEKAKALIPMAVCFCMQINILDFRKAETDLAELLTYHREQALAVGHANLVSWKFLFTEDYKK